MISVTTEAPEKTDTAPVSGEQVEEEVQMNNTAPVSAEPVDEEVQMKDTAPVSTPPSSSDEEIKVVNQEQKEEVTPLQTPCRTPRECFPIVSNGKLLEVALVATTPRSGPNATVLKLSFVLIVKLCNKLFSDKMSLFHVLCSDS